jgi:hypothetical protein
MWASALPHSQGSSTKLVNFQFAAHVLLRYPDHDGCSRVRALGGNTSLHRCKVDVS